MQKNVGTLDRIIRTLLGVALIAVYFLDIAQGTPGIVALVAGIVLLGTAELGWCPPYWLLGISTCRASKKDLV